MDIFDFINKYPEMNRDAEQWGIFIWPQGRSGAAAKQWAREIVMAVNALSGSKVGVSLLSAVRYRRPVVVVPNSNPAGHKHFCNAFGGSEFMKNVQHTPDRWVGGTCSSGPGASAAEIMFHELVHVVRALSGEFSRRKLTGHMAGYTNEEEFFAVVITNLYISESGGVLRANHAGFQRLAPPLDTSSGFLRDPANLLLIGKLLRQHPTWMTQLATLNVPFNPIREYVKVRESASEKWMREWRA